MTKQRIYKTYICRLCNKTHKENAWWRHGIGRCIKDERPIKTPFSFRFEYGGQIIWYTAWGIDYDEALSKVNMLYDNPEIIKWIVPETALVPPDIKSAQQAVAGDAKSEVVKQETGA